MHRFETSDGIAIAWREAANAGADRSPVVLQHGFAVSSALNWGAPGIIEGLGAAGHRVIVVDARGHGESDKPHDSAFYGEARMATDLIELLDAIGVERLDLVGYSMGAIVAVLCAIRDPRIRRLVVGGVGEGLVECGGVDTRALDNRDIVSALLADDPASVTNPAAGFRAMTDALGGDRLALAAQARVVHASPIPFEEITARTLVLAGDRDPLARSPERLAEAIRGARLRRVSGDHLGAVRDPAFLAHLLDFLA